ncbi:MAG: GNAT family N-acetyltransferase [Acidobacteria bacterium]|nr:GNAT family N-acetyltransferase [Acidobacteriota bacterium]
MDSIRNMVDSDIPDVDGILMAAHLVQASYATILTRNFHLTPDSWWVLEQDGITTGVVGATDFGPFAHIGLMAIHPSRQSGGTGSKLLQYALDQLDQRGFESITLYSTDAGLAFYPRHGFRWQGISTEWKLRKRKPHSRHYKISKTTDLDRIIAVDRSVFGGNRLALLAALEAEAPGRILVAEDTAGTIQGFLVAQPKVLGPYMALSKQAAADLLDAALDLDYDGETRVALPDAHADAESLMAEAGFVPIRTSRYFIRGKAPAQQRQLMYGQAAYSLG